MVYREHKIRSELIKHFKNEKIDEHCLPFYKEKGINLLKRVYPYFMIFGFNSRICGVCRPQAYDDHFYGLRSFQSYVPVCVFL